jgi:hypothetical protein
MLFTLMSYYNCSILQDSMASTYDNEGPKPWFRVEMSIFYIVFFVVFPFFFVNIFVALIIVTFNELGEAELQDDMDKNQKSCIDFAIQAKPLELYVPEEQNGIRYHIWRLVTSTPFENFIMLLIVCNTILLMLKVRLFKKTIPVKSRNIKKQFWTLKDTKLMFSNCSFMELRGTLLKF